ncbi:hypothetical protein, partial [Methylobacterium haplocladii]|uniref:hypothetical protein n=1 Tax=Methylobacterium haplocladii TaxID=1176176 RepID=UPI001AEE59E3
ELSSLQDSAASEATCRRLGKVQVLAERISRELANNPVFSKKSSAGTTTLGMNDHRLAIAAAV